MMNKAPPPNPAGELLYGAPIIAAFLGLSTRQVYHLFEKGSLSGWKEGAKVVARRSTLLAWIAEREISGRQNGAPRK